MTSLAIKTVLTHNVFPQHHRRLPVLYDGTSEANIRDFLLKKVLRPEACNFIKKRLKAQVFSYELCVIS